MIKLILECNSIDYDAYLNDVIQKAKEHPEMTGGIKLPKGIGAVLNHMPKKAKNEMIAKAINSHSEAAIPRVQQLLYNVLGPVEIHSFHIDCGTISKESVVMTSEIAHFNGAILRSRYYRSIIPKKQRLVYSRAFHLVLTGLKTRRSLSGIRMRRICSFW